MDALEYATDIVLPDTRVAVSGDWHGNVGWVRTLARVLPVLAPDITTLFQLGDWAMDPGTMDDVFQHTAITRVYVVAGNHERWDRITPLLHAAPGSAVRISDITWLLPRPARLSVGGRQVLAVPGAASVDRLWRKEGVSWWPDEAITDEHVAQAIAGGPADLMLTHEGPARTPVRAIRELLRTNPLNFPAVTLAESKASRERIAEVWDAVHPTLLMHGHMHVGAGGAMKDGRRVASFGCEVQEGNLAFLDLDTLRLDTPSLKQIRVTG